MNNFSFIFFLFFLFSLTGCSYITGPEGFFPETKNDFFDEKLSEDLKLPDTKNNPERVEFHLTLCGTNWHKNQIVFRIFIRVFIRVCKSPFIRVFIRVLFSDQN